MKEKQHAAEGHQTTGSEPSRRFRELEVTGRDSEVDSAQPGRCTLEVGHAAVGTVHHLGENPC